jgi:sugar lactone lactonase YvrE
MHTGNFFIILSVLVNNSIRPLTNVKPMPTKLPLLTLLLYCCGFFACSKKTTGAPTASFSITGILPAAGTLGTAVTITGANFGNSTSGIKVFFNNKPATITLVNANSIQAVVPAGAGTGYVTLQKNNETVKGPAFTYQYTVTVSTLAGKGYSGYKDGPASEALLFLPRGIAINSRGDIYIADNGNRRIRKISASGMVTTVAGNGIKSYRDGPAPDAAFYGLNGLICDANDNLFIADGTRIRLLNVHTNIVSTLAGDGNMGNIDGKGINAELNLPYGLAIDGTGNLLVTDAGNNNVRNITPDGVVTTLAGSNAGFADGIGKNALFTMPGQLTIDSRNNIYVADAGNFRIRKMNAQGDVFTYAGDGNFGYTDGRFYQARFQYPTGITTDTAGNVYLCGAENVIRRITPGGDVTTIAGNGINGYSNGPADGAMFNQPIYMVTSSTGALYVADESNHCIRKIVIE